MNKEQYLASIKEGLKSLPTDEINATLNALDKQITSYQQQGMSDQKIFHIMPKSDEIIAKILKPSSLENPNPKKDIKQPSKPESNNFFHMITKLIEIMKQNDVKNNFQIIKDLLILLILISLLKIPFILVRNLLDTFLVQLNIPLLYNIYGYIIEIAYIILAIIVFIHIFKKWFKNLSITPAQSKIKKPQLKPMGEELTSISLTENNNSSNEDKSN